MNISSYFTAAKRLALPTLLVTALAAPAWGLIEYSDGQRETIVELIDQLQERHYAKLKYDDRLSSQHLDGYIDSLDRNKMFFIESDIEEFEQYRTVMDDQLPSGQLDAGYVIFNRFQQRLEERLQSLMDTLPEFVAGLDFTRDENYVLDADDRWWAKTPEELNERWRKQVKNEVLRLKLTEKDEHFIAIQRIDVAIEVLGGKPVVIF